MTSFTTAVVFVGGVIVAGVLKFLVHWRSHEACKAAIEAEKRQASAERYRPSVGEIRTAADRRHAR